MIKNFFSARLLVAALCVFVANLTATARVAEAIYNLASGNTPNGFAVSYGEGSGATLNDDGTVQLAKQAGGNPNTGIEITIPESFSGDKLSILVGYEGLDRPGANIAYLEIQTDENKKVLAAGNGSNTIYVSTFEGDAGSAHSQGVNDNTSLNAPTEGWMYVSLDKSRNFKFGFITSDGTRTAIHERQVGAGYANGFKKILVGGSTAAIGKYHRIGAKITSIKVFNDEVDSTIGNKISDWNEIDNFADEPYILNLAGATIEMDEPLGAKSLAIETDSTFSFTRSESISDENVSDFFSRVTIDGKGYDVFEPFKTELKFDNGVLDLSQEGELTVKVPTDEQFKMSGVKGGTLVKDGEGELSVSGRPAISETTIKIEGGSVYLAAGSSGVSLENPTFIIGEYGELKSQAGMSILGTLTLYSDYEKSVFADADIWEGPTIVKEGYGRVKVMCGSKNNNGNKQPFSNVIVNSGTLAFGGSGIKEITNLEGNGTLEQAGGREMTISKVSSDVSLCVSGGTLTNSDETCDTLAGLKVTSNATYVPPNKKFSITKELHLEGEHKTWWITLADGALITTDPGNPMQLAALDFGENVVLGKDQAVGSVLAKLDGKPTLPSLAKSENGVLAQIDFGLDYIAKDLVVTRKTGSDAEATIVPGYDLDGGGYQVEMTLPSDYDASKGKLFAHIIMPNTSDALSEIEPVGDGSDHKWCATLYPDYESGIGQISQVTVEIGVLGSNGAFIPVDTFDDITINVRPEAVNKNWINEPVYQRWGTGDWDVENDDDYITLSEGYVQIEDGKTISFTPQVTNEEAVTKLHFAVKFGGALKLAILNAISVSGQLAGIGLEKAEDGTIGYAALDPKMSQYVSMVSSDKKPIDIASEHLVEVTLSKSGISYAIDGASLVTKDEKRSAVFALPTNASIKVAKIDFIGEGAVKSMTAEEYSTKLAKYGNTEYDTIEDALAKAKTTGDKEIVINALWNTNWEPEFDEALTNKLITFTGKDVSVDDGKLSGTDYVLRPEEGGKKYMLISKYMTITIPDPEDIDGFGVFLESVTTNSMHLGWVYDYESDKPHVAKATIVYDDDVTIEFSSKLEIKKDALVNRVNKESLKSITFTGVRSDTSLGENDIPVIDGNPVEGLAAFARAGVARSLASDVAGNVANVNIVDFTTRANGVSFRVAITDPNDQAELAAITSELKRIVYYTASLSEPWINIEEAESEDFGVTISAEGVVTITKMNGTSGFYKVVIPAE